MPDAATLAIAVFSQLIMLPSAYFTLEPLHESGNLSRKAFFVLIALVAALGVVCGVASEYSTAVFDVLFVLSSIVGIAVLLAVSHTSLVVLLFLFFTGEVFVYSAANLARVVALLLGAGSADVQDAQAFAIIELLVTWTIIVLEVAFSMRLFHERIPYLLERVDAEHRTFWRFVWLVPLAIYAVQILLLPDDGMAAGTAMRAIADGAAVVVLFGAYVTILGLSYSLARQSQMLEEDLNRRHSLELRLQQAGNTQDRIEEARKARHDLRHFQRAVAGLVQKGDMDALRTYMADLQAVVDESPLTWCENPTANSIIGHYVTKARKVGAKVLVDATCPVRAGITDVQIAVVLGNVLENAVEALTRAAQAGPDKGDILHAAPTDAAPQGSQAATPQEADPEAMPKSPQLLFSVKLDCAPEGLFKFEVRNSYTGVLKYDSTGTLASTRHAGAGIGTQSVRTLAEECGGFARFGDEGGLFRSLVVIPPSAHTRN